MVVLLAPITNYIADDGGVRINVGRVIVKRRDGVQVRGGVYLSGGLVHDLDGGSRGRAGVLRVHGNDDDSIDAPCAEVFHDCVDVRLAVLHSDGDVVLFTEETRELLGEVLRVEQKRGTAVGVPDRCISLCGFLRALRQDEEVEDKPFQQRVEIDDTGVTQELAEVLAYVGDLE